MFRNPRMIFLSELRKQWWSFCDNCVVFFNLGIVIVGLFRISCRRGGENLMNM